MPDTRQDVRCGIARLGGRMNENPVVGSIKKALETNKKILTGRFSSRAAWTNLGHGFCAFSSQKKRNMPGTGFFLLDRFCVHQLDGDARFWWKTKRHHRQNPIEIEPVESQRMSCPACACDWPMVAGRKGGFYCWFLLCKRQGNDDTPDGHFHCVAALCSIWRAIKHRGVD